MPDQSKGFSLTELLTALFITLGIGMAVFQLFRQNERVFREQNLMIEMQQSARAVASQIADEVRMAGQGVPVYASTFDEATHESIAVVLASSSNSRIDFRAGLSNAETNVTAALPIDCPLHVPLTIAVGNGSSFSNALGTTTPIGKFVYIWGPASVSMWTWVRAELASISSNSLTIIPRQGGDGGLRFTQPPTVSLEEAVSFQLSGTTIKRATATNMTDQTSPIWSAPNEIGRNFTSMSFTYYDINDNVITPSSLANRISVARVGVRVTAQASDALSNGDRPTYPLSLQTIPRNVRLR